MAPLEAKEFFGRLPPGNSKWKLLRSTARTVYNNWLVVYVTRAYEGLPLPAADPKAPPVIPKTEIVVCDTGKFPAFNGVFLGGRKERETIDGLPVARAPGLPAGTESIQVWIGERFIVKITTENQAAGAPGEWLKSIKVDELKALAVGGSHTLSNPVTMYRIDELNPAKNNSYSLSWTTEEAVERANHP